MSLKRIDFSDGIRSDNIQYNFEDLQSQINYDRSFIVGPGIAKGLNIDVDEQNYIVTISDGTIIDPDGEIIDVEGKKYEIDLPSNIMQTIIKDMTVKDNKITLTDIPYATNGRYIAAIDDKLNDYHNDIVVSTPTGSEITDYKIESTQPNVLVFNNISDDTILTIQYYIAYNIIFTIYINTENKIQVCRSISSTSPSEYGLSDFKYKLGNIFVRSNVNGYTTISKIQDMSDRVNIYTDEDGNLYINGKPFSSITNIYLYCPSNPKENDIWYNGEYGNNQLLVYRIIDGIGGWYPISTYTYVLHNKSKLWSPLDELSYNADTMHPSYFLFKDTEKDLYFEPKTESLKVVVDNTVLHSDQFEEITARDVYNIFQTNSDESLVKYITACGYNKSKLQSLLYQTDNSGNIIGEKDDTCIGFKMIEPFTYRFTLTDYAKGPYVEAIVTQSYLTPSLKRKTERVSTYVSEVTITPESQNVAYDEGNHFYVVTTDSNYLYNENQLEVFINGVKLIKNVDYSEVMMSLSSKESNRFIITKSIGVSDYITYRINTNVYSYDELKNDNSRYWLFDQLITRNDNSVDIDLPESLSLDDRSFVIAFRKSDRGVLIRKTETVPDNADYEIIRDEENSKSVFHIIDESSVKIGDSVYLVGLKQKFDGVDYSSSLLKIIDTGAIVGQLLRVAETENGNVTKLRADNIVTIHGEEADIG